MTRSTRQGPMKNARQSFAAFIRWLTVPLELTML
jgi:hypothetical protein